MSKLRLYQLIDSNFPTGMFSHSFGFETYLQKEVITTPEDFQKWLLVYIEEQLTYNDLLAMRAVFEVFTLDHILTWTRKLHAQTMAKEVRLGNQRMGQQFLQLFEKISPNEVLKSYAAALKQEGMQAHPAMVFVIIAKPEVDTEQELLSAYAYSIMSALVQNGVRGVPLGQVAGQRLILELSIQLEKNMNRVIKQLTAADFGMSSPAIEIRQMQHEWLRARNFMS
jgi:urease accessory protein